MARSQYYKKNRQYGVKFGGAVNLRKQQYKANMDIRYLKSIVNSELFSHTGSTSNNIDSTGTVLSLNDVPQGDGGVSRTGLSILPRYQSINISINKSLTGPAHETFRLIVFRYWGEATSVAPSVTVSEILQNVNPHSYLNDDNTGSRGDRERRIEVHKSKLFTLDNVSDTSRTWKWNIQVNGQNVRNKQHIKYRDGTTESPISGGFYVLILSTNGTGGNKSSFTTYYKLGFYDN